MKFSEMNMKEKFCFFFKRSFSFFILLLSSILIFGSISSKDCFDLLFGFFGLSSIWIYIYSYESEDLNKKVDDIKEQLVSLNDFFIDCADK